jgi:hypothetical protein
MPDPFQVLVVQYILSPSDMHHTYIGTTHLPKGIHIIVSNFMWNGRGSGNDLDAGGSTPALFYNASQDSKFEEIKVASVNFSFLKVGSFILSTSNSD